MGGGREYMNGRVQNGELCLVFFAGVFPFFCGASRGASERASPPPLFPLKTPSCISSSFRQPQTSICAIFFGGFLEGGGGWEYQLKLIEHDAGLTQIPYSFAEELGWWYWNLESGIQSWERGKICLFLF